MTPYRLSESYRLEADTIGYVIRKYGGTSTNGKTGETVEVWKPVGYFSCLDQAFRWWADEVIRISASDLPAALQEAIAELRRLREEFAESLREVVA